MFGCLYNVVCIFNLLNMLMMYEPCVCVKGFICQQRSANKLFMGIVASKPLRDFTCPLGIPRDLKGLLHMLNAIVFPMKADLCLLSLMCFFFIIIIILFC